MDSSVQLLSTPKTKKKCEEQFEERICIVHNFNLKNHGQLKPITNKRWTKIQEIKTVRSNADDDKGKQIHVCDKIPDEIDLTKHGYHDYCYTSFISLKNLTGAKRQISCADPQEGGSCSKSKRKKKQQSKILFPVQCLFCDKTIKWLYGHHKNRDPLVRCLTKTAERSIKEAVECKKNI